MTSIILSPAAADLLDAIARAPCFPHLNEEEEELFDNGLLRENGYMLIELTPLGEQIAAANRAASA